MERAQRSLAGPGLWAPPRPGWGGLRCPAARQLPPPSASRRWRGRWPAVLAAWAPPAPELAYARTEGSQEAAPRCPVTWPQTPHPPPAALRLEAGREREVACKGGGITRGASAVSRVASSLAASAPKCHCSEGRWEPSISASGKHKALR